GDNGNGMHCHQSVFKDGTNVFAGDGYGNLSQEALWYIGGITAHARALNAFANPTTNSYKRLVPGFEAPLLLVYSAMNRSAGIRIPYVQGGSPNGVRAEVRFGDTAANPYLMFASMLMAGLDGIKNKIEPVGPLDKDLYDLPAEETKDLPTVCSSLEQALDALDADREFLNQGDVFSDSMIDGYIDLKREEVELLNATTHPVEFQMYYSV
ncbi:MAG: glutamine synthetase, partial [Proteobacteria bacterium]|nr:glutamine synthetase [Pseudomonadota bacterium]